MSSVRPEKTLERADANHRVLEPAHRYAEKQACWHGRLLRALQPYGDRSTSVGQIVAAAEARDGAAAG